METYDVTNPAKPTILKDPDATLDYTFDWTEWLASASNPADTITAATCSVADTSNATVASQAFDTSKVTAWVEGGLPGEKVSLTCHITTAAGRIDDRTVYLKIKER